MIWNYDFIINSHQIYYTQRHFQPKVVAILMKVYYNFKAFVIVNNIYSYQIHKF